MSNDSLGDRMKGYENIERKYLTRRMPCLLRLDGKSFHSFTKGFQKPFDMVLMQTMWNTAKYLCENIMGCKLAYVQSDEISLLLTDYDEIETQAWFDKNVQKMVSISASMATMVFNNVFRNIFNNIDLNNIADYVDNYYKKIGTAMFDSRVFNIPKEEVCNAFIWRQQDATRNAIQMVGQANFSHKQLQNKSCNQIQEMLFQEKSINFNDLPTYQKRGVCIIKETYMKDETERSRWKIDKDIPVFTQDRDYIERYL
jgi:tRNA(His) 5'-end guanylyltransferase